MNAFVSPKRLVVSLESAALLPGVGVSSPVSLAGLAEGALSGGADGVMIHLTEDHGLVSEANLRDIAAVCASAGRPFHIRMTSANDMVALALRHCPSAVYLGGETRVRGATGFGLSLKYNLAHVERVSALLADSGIRSVICLEPTLEAMETAIRSGLAVVELDTLGMSQMLEGVDLRRLELELGRLISIARYGSRHGIEVQLGGGLNMLSLAVLSRSPFVRQINVGKAMIAGALACGMPNMVRAAKASMLAAGLQGDSVEVRRRRLIHRANYRGFKEMDIILSTYFNQQGPKLDDPDLLIAEQLLELPDHVLFDLISSKMEPESALRVSVLSKLRSHYRTGALCAG